jgi:laminin beta 1
VVIREPFRDGRESTWTGPGFVRATDDSFLEFDVNDVTSSMEYDLIIRYEPMVLRRLLNCLEKPSLLDESSR